MTEQSEKPIFPPFDSNPKLVVGVVLGLFVLGVVVRLLHSLGVI